MYTLVYTYKHTRYFVYSYFLFLSAVFSFPLSVPLYLLSLSFVYLCTSSCNTLFLFLSFIFTSFFHSEICLTGPVTTLLQVTSSLPIPALLQLHWQVTLNPALQLQLLISLDLVCRWVTSQCRGIILFFKRNIQSFSISMDLGPIHWGCQTVFTQSARGPLRLRTSGVQKYLLSKYFPQLLHNSLAEKLSSCLYLMIMPVLPSEDLLLLGTRSLTLGWLV